MMPSQCRAARGLLDWTQDQLASAARVRAATISKFENGISTLQQVTLHAIQHAFEAAGVEFTNGGQPGVRLKASPLTISVDQPAVTTEAPERITGAQIRAGRALLNWSTAVLAKRCGVPRAVILKAEGVDSVPRVGTKQLAAIKKAIEEGGVELLGSTGVNRGER
jgi:transcriptional regulator with XRE-family HTH domain